MAEHAVTDRRTYVGGSDLGDVLNLQPYGCRRRLWFEKRGEAPEKLSTYHMERGTAMEPIIASVYAQKTGRRVRRKAEVSDSDVAWRKAHPDYHIVAFDDRGPGLLSIKCPSLFAFKRVKQEGLSQAYIAQLQYELGLAGWKWGAYAIFNPELWELLHWDVNADPALFPAIVNAVDDFAMIVDNGPAPNAFDAKDRRCLRCSMRPRCHGEEALPEHTGHVESDPSLAPLMAEYSEAAEIFDDAEQLLDRVKDRIRTVLGERTCVDTTGGRIYFAAQTRTSIDGKGLKAKYPDIAREFERVSKFRSLRIFEKKN